MTGENVELRLTTAEALVLFEWLAAAHDAEQLIVDEAEQRVLWDLESQLETKLVEPLMPNCTELVDAAKRAVLGA
ncbi:MULTISPECIES: hypothetical protein [unclassified Microbacterium]|uniref:hypothetical protein n=1 Tax=unclassified Microbacterium TaxID=2609290 RepID=UPI000CFD47A4|nr:MULTISPECIES: hypothetical protein [unclassified Microbacterium]PQZ57477.1 hypothetical protein CQ032_08750 [Microbacterium sp. MYb43]PQZ77313.1 hypothetical protein CQ031_11755 [Microbacterium sp. MYb40]PRB22726.1 hypothetical protein CQ040_04990 [Microbacterium sp. MYb54]PRB28932.1 hypothetical protein CQ037_09020 [Microbacterium sp. MYb50]PRB68992.1 hypothetical protein CQ021_05155 [Microbacterium sp. MYb24]